MPSGPNSTAPPLWLLNGWSTWRITCSLAGSAMSGSDGRHGERGDDRIAVSIGVVDEETRVGRVVRVEGQSQQASFATAGDPIRDVQERPIDELAVPHDPDPAGLLDDEDATAPIARVGHVDRGVQAGQDDGRVGGRDRSAAVDRCRGCLRRPSSGRSSVGRSSAPRSRVALRSSRSIRTRQARSRARRRERRRSGGASADGSRDPGSGPPAPAALPPGRCAASLLGSDRRGGDRDARLGTCRS